MKTLIAIPAMDTVHTLFFMSMLGLRKPPGTEVTVVSSSLIYDSRNSLAQKAIDEGFDRVLWLDSDMRFDPDMLERMNALMDEGHPFVCGLFFTRKAPIAPCVYSVLDQHDGTPICIPFRQWGEAPFEAQACGFGAVLTSVDLLRQVMAQFPQPFTPIPGFSEDFSFCLRARAFGVFPWCDPRIKVDHIGISIFNDSTYRAVKEAEAHGR